jgi:hypothetical protein
MWETGGGDNMQVKVDGAIISNVTGYMHAIDRDHGGSWGNYQGAENKNK